MIRTIDRSVWDAAPRETLPHIDAIPYGTLPRLGCYPAWDAALYGTLARMGRRPAWDAGLLGTLELYLYHVQLRPVVPLLVEFYPKF